MKKPKKQPEQPTTPPLEYVVHPSIKPFHESHAQVKALCGPVGCGKSLAAAFEFFFMCTESVVPVHGVVIRESYRQLHDSTRRTVQKWFGHCSTYLKGDEQLRLTIPNFKGDVLTHELDFRHCRRPEEVSNLLSTEYAFIWLEEPVPAYQMEGGIIGAGLPYEVFDMAQMRQRQEQMHRLQILLSFNPPPKSHWVHTEFFQRSQAELAQLDYALFRCKPFENAPNLPPGYYQKLLARLGEDLARRFVLGEIVTLYPGVRVFTDVWEQHHFKSGLKAQQGLPLVLGFDFGLTPAVLIAQVKPNGVMKILREIQMFSAGIVKLKEQLKVVLADEFSGFRNWRCWGDPAGAQRAQTDERTCYQVLGSTENGDVAFTVQPGAEDFQTRFEAVTQRLRHMIDGEPALQIDQDGCPILTEGLLGGYRYPRSRDGDVGKRPMKNRFSHLADSLQYLCSGEFSLYTGKLKNQEPHQRLPIFDPFTRISRSSSGASWMGR